MKQEIDRIVLEEIPFLYEKVLSVFVVGSMASINYQEKDFNDYDIRFIVDEVNPSIMQKIDVVLERIKDKIVSQNIGCEISKVIGPAKMEKQCYRNVLLHALVMTNQDLEHLPNIHKYSYSNQYRVLYGEDYIAPYQNLQITKEDVISSVEGIDYCIDLLKNQKIRYSQWVYEDDMHLEDIERDANCSELMELFYYSYHKAMNNIQNMIDTNHLSCSIVDYLNYSFAENNFVFKLENYCLESRDINDNNIELMCLILNKLKGVCDNMYTSKSEYHNSLEWGILRDNTSDIRGDGFDYIKRLGLPIGNNFSISYCDYEQNKCKIQEVIKDSKYIIIFDPPGYDFLRLSLGEVVNDTNRIDEFLKSNSFINDYNIPLNYYNISFIEFIEKIPTSYAGVVMSDGQGNTVIETVSDTCDSRELTSRGADRSRIKDYTYISFDDYIVGAPKAIQQIKNVCQYFRGYYEFAYGKIREVNNIYFTYYSNNPKYTNIFEGGKIKCKSIMK